MSVEVCGRVGIDDKQSRLSAFTIKYVIYTRVSDTPRISRLDLLLLRIFVDPPKLSCSLAGALRVMLGMYAPGRFAVYADREAPAKASSVAMCRSRK